MRKTTAAGLFPAAILLAAAAGAAETVAAAVSHERFGWFASLAGSCWRGTYPGGGGDIQCYEWQYGRYLRGTIEIDTKGKEGAEVKLAGDSVYDWDGKAGRIRYSNWADAGSLQHGEAYYEGELLRFPVVKSADEEPRARSTWRRIDADTFEVTRERLEGGAWTAELSVTYRRSARGPD
ncbi:MAG TPA: hypothetical protein VFU77_00790 [Steroidobacteraceae bacterium]|nr:hypothetical protein [Steroidobacteraceae bacterium]